MLDAIAISRHCRGCRHGIYLTMPGCRFIFDMPPIFGFRQLFDALFIIAGRRRRCWYFAACAAAS